MPSVLITTSSFGSGDSSSKDKLQKEGFSLHENPFGRTLTAAEAIELLDRYHPVGMVAGVEPLTGEVLQGAAGYLRVISRCGTGLDNVDLQAAREFGITVFNTPEAPACAVAELAMGFMLNLARHITPSDRNVRLGHWKKSMGFLLRELTIGIIGLGRVGKKVAMMAGSFGASIVGFDIKPDLAWGLEHGVSFVSLKELLSTADIVTLHLPHALEKSRYFIGKDELRLMKPESYLINTSRGGLVDESILYEALKKGHLAGAAIDTFENEPYQGPLCQLGNVILSPHTGSYARAARVQMEEEAVQNLIHGLKSQGAVRIA